MIENPGVCIVVKGEELILLPEKAVFFKEERILLVSDVHLGKGMHFRKAGIAIPQALEQEDLSIISDLINLYTPVKIIFLGDLFHSEFNNDWHWFKYWREHHKKISMILIKGNHDILEDKFFHELNIEVVNELKLKSFLLVHDVPQTISEEAYPICGHLHPAVTIKGQGRQRITLPCFWFTENYARIPAFGRFTGTAGITAKPDDIIYAVAGEKIFKVGSPFGNT